MRLLVWLLVAQLVSMRQIGLHMNFNGGMTIHTLNACMRVDTMFQFLDAL